MRGLEQTIEQLLASPRCGSCDKEFGFYNPATCPHRCRRCGNYLLRAGERPEACDRCAAGNRAARGRVPLDEA